MALRQTVGLEPGIEPFRGYCLQRRLGAGGFGEVWQADAPNDRQVALKFLPCKTEASTAQEIRSLQAIRQLRHPHLIQIDRVWCHLGYVIVCMELAEGNLQDLLEVYQEEFGTPVAREHACQLLAQ